MKKILQVIFGYGFVFRLVDFKNKYFPNSLQKKYRENEEAELSRRKIFYSSFVRPQDVCFDVGANIGNRIKPMLDIGAKVIAVEPQESCYKFLEYKFGNKIKIIKKGLGREETIKDFHVSDYSVISSFSDDWIEAVKEKRFKGQQWNKVVKTEMTTLDKLISKFGVPAFIKIDVEGYESEVLKGLSHKINMISFEYTVPEQTDKAIECISQLEQINPAVQFNYSIGESMVFAREKWLNATEMRDFIVSPEFAKNGFGDIYASNKD